MFGSALLAFLLLSPDASIKLVKTDEAKIDIFAGEELFTCYHYGLGFHKPIFHPLKSPAGNVITRGYPMELGIPGEKHDHWHHESMFFTYGNVNGIDFWAKKGAANEEGGSESGKIRHTGFTKIESGKKGHLGATADWITPTGKVLLKQKSDVIFSATPQARVMDWTIVLTAQREKVTFRDTKEGMLGIRVAPDLQEEQTGTYINAEGLQREARVWGKRSPWVALRGKVKEEDVTLAVFNHPESAGFPTYWHARGYGLFAVNPFGRKDFEKDARPLNFSLGPGKSALFRYRILIHSGRLTVEELKQKFHEFSKSAGVN